ncbi:MAG: hypothetical protein ACI4D9_00410 [Lachnospiraceae bacterium]
MKAVKGNKEYTIEESQKKAYQDRGFDIKEDSGKVITYGRGKTVPYDEYEKLMAENNMLKEKILKETAMAENNALKEQLDSKTKESEGQQVDSDEQPDEQTADSDEQGAKQKTSPGKKPNKGTDAVKG